MVVRWSLLVLIVLAVGAQAQTATLNGFVRDGASGETLIQATVQIERADGGASGRGTATNVQGFYTLGGLAPGTLTVVSSYVGYRTVRQTVTLAPGETRRLDLDLPPEGVVSDEVVVEGEEPLEEERAPGVQNVSIDLVEALPTVFEADLFRSIQLLPGVKSANDFSSALYIRGGSPDQTLILLDGTTVYNPTHFFGFFSTFNTEAIKDVRLYKGAYPSTYGGRLGSVIDIYNRDGNQRERHGSLTLGLLASRVGVEGPVAGGRATYSLNARRSTLEPLLAVLREQLDEDGIPESFSFYDVNGKVSVDPHAQRPGQPRRLRRARTGWWSRSATTPRFDLDYGNRTASLAYNRILSGTAFAQTRLTASRYFSYPVGDIGGTTFERPNTITDYSARADVEWLPSERFELRTGVWGGLLNLGSERAASTAPPRPTTRTPRATSRATCRARFGPGNGFHPDRRPPGRDLPQPDRRPDGRPRPDALDLHAPLAPGPGRADVRGRPRAPGRCRALPPVPLADLERGVLRLRHLGDDGRGRAAPVERAGRARAENQADAGLAPRRRGLRADAPAACSTRGPRCRTWRA